MPTCKTCKFWVDGCCDMIDFTDPRSKKPKPSNHFEVDVTVSDDTGLDVRLRTGPDFGCVLHEDLVVNHP